MEQRDRQRTREPSTGHDGLRVATIVDISALQRLERILRIEALVGQPELAG
jgi:hypothetical protein